MYQLKILGKAQKDLKNIDRAYQKIIKEKLIILAQNPEILKTNIKKLSGNNELYRLRIGSYRVIFERKDRELIVLVVRIGHRKEIYLSLK